MRAFLRLLVLPVIFVSMSAVAETPWSFQLGASQVNPKSDNGSLASGTLKAEVSSEVNLTPSIQYAFSPNVVGELLLALPYKHDVDVTGGALNNAEVASFKHLPPTVSLKYVFAPDSSFSPYIGLGVNYTLVFDEETTGALAGTSLKGDNSLGLAASAGFEYRMPDSRWGFAADIRYIDIESDLTLDGADIGTLEVDPVVIGLSAVFHY